MNKDDLDLLDHLRRISMEPLADRDELLRQLRRDRPELKDKFRSLRQQSWVLWGAVEHALVSALSRADLTADEKSEAHSDAWHCAAAIKVADTPDPHGLLSGLLPSRIAIDFAFSALFLGLRAGLGPEEIEKIRASWKSDMGRSAALKSAEARKKKPWQTYVRKENARLKSANPTLTKRSRRADKIMASEGWAKGNFKKVGRERLEQFLMELDREGQIPK